MCGTCGGRRRATAREGGQASCPGPGACRPHDATESARAAPGSLPTLPEDGLHVVDGRPLDRHLDVVPRRVRAVLLGERLGLRVTAVRGVVPPVVGQVDPADEGHVAGGVVTVPDHDELLVVGAARAHAHVEQHLGASLLQLLAEVTVLGGEEPGLVQVRAPHQPVHGDATLVRAGEHLDHLAARLPGELFVAIALPVGEENQVTRRGRLERVVQGAEVRRAVDQRTDVVALRPGPVTVQVVQPGQRVRPLAPGQQPVSRVDHALSMPHSPA